MNAVVKAEKNEIQAAESQTPAGVSPLVAMLASGQLQAEHVEQAMALQQKHDEYEARKAYNVDMAKAKAEMGVASKSQKNDFVGSSYANLSDLIKAAGPALSKYGFNWSWKIDASEKGFITANCNMTHKLGHCETFPCRLPDAIVITSKKGTTVNNPAQAAGSARTYAKRYSFEDAVGIASQDDDGQAMTRPAQAEPMLDKGDMEILKAECVKLGKDFGKYMAYMGKKLPVLDDVLQVEKSRLGVMLAEIRSAAKKNAAAAKTEGSK